MDETASRGPFLYEENAVFRNSAFFTKPNEPVALPSPTEVREAASRSSDPNVANKNRPPPVVFPDLGLLVKYGREITIAEGQCLLFVRNNLSNVVPIPEVYGWCKDDGQVFIYMELVEGITLEKSWEAMAESERMAVCQQLREMINAWRGLKQEFSPPFIGHVGRQPLLDVIFTSSCSPTAGPFSSVPEFHDWFTSTFGPSASEQNRAPHPYRSNLPDDATIVFTHADLHPSNIILSAGPNPRVLAIIDWHQSGWYPDYWEYCKALWTAPIRGEWECKYLPMFLDRRDCYDYWDYFVLARGV
ncbi:kinase-like protein [Pyrenochaeta sp. DS3sAY3a]|nr:kinase-like protein [Pyrenochaeta sp. DS3sAY3a]